jgi:hypothetical protein
LALLDLPESISSGGNQTLVEIFPVLIVKVVNVGAGIGGLFNEVIPRRSNLL